MNADEIFLILFVVATTVAVIARRFRLPYTAALVLAGLLLGSVHVLNPPHLTQALLFSVFLPGLLFEAAFHMDFQAFWRDRFTILGLAAPGVVAAITLTTVFLTRLFNAFGLVRDIDWRDALLFSAVVAATDPVAVVALFKKLNAPARLTLLIEGESLLNDGTAIVLFSLVLALVSGQQWSASSLAVDFGKIVGGGAVLGGIIGAGAGLLMRRIDDPMIEITLTTIAAYGSFVVADQLGYSGVIAVVVAGMVCGNYGARTGMAPSTRVAAEVFWEYTAFALNSVVFLLIGFEVPLASLAASWPAILLAYLAVTVARGGVIVGMAALGHRRTDAIPSRWAVVLTWGGLRGALSMVLALSLPMSVHRPLLVTMTFGVVLLSILVQGLTMAPLLRWLGIVRLSEDRLKYEQLRGRLQTATRALAEIDDMQRTRFASDEVLETLKQRYRQVVRDAEGAARELNLAHLVLREDEMRAARRHLLLVEKQYLLDAQSQGTLGRIPYERLLADVDAQLTKVEFGEEEPSDDQSNGDGPQPKSADVPAAGDH